MTWMIQYGFGKHIFVLPLVEIPKAVEVFLKSLFIAEVCYTGTIVFAKFSILSFYWRLFQMNPFVRWSVIVISGIVTMWGTAVVRNPPVCSFRSQRMRFANRRVCSSSS